ncbi:probable threonine--tRNA ligase, cytoplasmic [Cicer arietinum]|uniref:probable threonine--tRNA ligase, cytoplasmic n=1 Tax=Cicer arietinum TaxID=3827 RepID=UPI003CC6C87D
MAAPYNRRSRTTNDSKLLLDCQRQPRLIVTIMCNKNSWRGIKPALIPKLPLRFADFGVLHQNEAIASLHGLTHTRRFQQDDAHIFCRKSQIKDEVIKALNFMDYVYQIFGFTYEVKLSTKPEKIFKDLVMWEKAENELREALDEFGKPWQFGHLKVKHAYHFEFNYRFT